MILISCGTEVKTEPKEDVQEPKSTVVEEIQEEESDEVFLVDEVVKNTDDDEYLRSIDNLDENDIVTKAEFEDDKYEILQIIDELHDIMEDQDTERWLKYITPDSKKYYSDPKNIRKAQKKLPDKTQQLYGIGDYFKYVFIPARKKSRVDEIRYISKTYVKAVQVKADNNTTVYYYFNKINNKWLVHIPPL